MHFNIEFAVPLALGATAGTVPSGLFVTPGFVVTGFTRAFDCASVDVVDETWRDPDDRRPLDEPCKITIIHYRIILLHEIKYNIPELFGECWLLLDADLGGGGPGGLGPFLGLPDGKVSVIDIKLAIGLCKDTIGAGGAASVPIETCAKGIFVG